MRIGSVALSFAAMGWAAMAAMAAAAPPAAPTSGAPTWDELGNTTFSGFEQLGGQVTLVNGKWEGEPFGEEGSARPTLTAAPGLRLTGDLDGDGVEEAVILLAESTGGSGTIQHLAAVRRVALGTKHVASAELGDRVTVRSARIEGNRLSARVIRAGRDDAACCPGEVADLSWTFANGRFVSAGAPAVVGRLSLETLAGTDWVLRGWNLDEPAPALPEVTLAIDGQRIVGHSGCNRYFATAKMSASPPGQLDVGELAGTRMACAEPATSVEARFRKALDRVERATFIAGQLALVYRAERGQYGALMFEARTPGAR